MSSLFTDPPRVLMKQQVWGAGVHSIWLSSLVLDFLFLSGYRRGDGNSQSHLLSATHSPMFLISSSRRLFEVGMIHSEERQKLRFGGRKDSPSVGIWIKPSEKTLSFHASLDDDAQR